MNATRFKLYKALALLLLNALVLSVLFASTANAQFVVQPMQHKKTLSPGMTDTITFTLTNKGETPVQVRPTAIDIARNKNNEWQVVKSSTPETEAGHTSVQSCKTWLSWPHTADNLITVPAKKKSTVKVSIQIPSDANGKYQAAMMFALIPLPDAQIKIRYDFVVPIELKVLSPEELAFESTPKLYHSIAPARIDLEGRPGQILTTTLTLYKPSYKRFKMDKDLPTSVSLKAIDISDINELKSPSSSPATSCESWLTWSTSGQQDTFSMEPNKPTQIPVSVEIPKEASGVYNSVLQVVLMPPVKTEPIATRYLIDIPVQVSVGETPTQKPHNQDNILIYNTGRYDLQQDSALGDPFYSYSGENYIETVTPFPTQITASMKALSPAKGDWTCCAMPKLVQNHARVKLNFLVKKLDIDKLPASNHVLLAELEIKLIPQTKF